MLKLVEVFPNGTNTLSKQEQRNFPHFNALRDSKFKKKQSL